MLKKTLLATALLLIGGSTYAADYFVVVPMPNKTVNNSAITVTLNGSTLPAGLIGTPYPGFNLSSLLSVTGDPGYTGAGVQWALVGGSLPAGLTLNNDGSLSGTPTAPGTASFQVRASYKAKTGEQAYQIVVANLTVGLAAGTPPEALVGQGYHYDLKPLLAVTGDSAYSSGNVTWSVVSSTLPVGLYLTSDGFIAGTPTAAGTGSITARATYKGRNGEQTYQVVSRLITVVLAGATLPESYVGTPYQYDLKPLLTVSGDPGFDVASVSWSLGSGSLPAGLTLSNAGLLSGTPTAASNGPVTVQATYKNAQGQQSYQLVVLNLVVSLASATLPTAVQSQTYSYDLKPLLSVTGDSAYAGAGAGVVWTLDAQAQAMPAGVTLTADGVLTGIPTTLSSGMPFTVKASYKSKSATQSYTIPVTGGITQNSGYRAWSDGSYAASCKEYRNGKPGFSYTGATGDGIYRIAVGGYAPVDVLCDMTNDGGGWTVFQRRTNGSVDFYRTYAEYAAGFGSATTEYWLGLDRLAAMTAAGATLRVDLQRYTGQTAYAKYTSFKINPASDAYRLTVSGYSGTAGDSLNNSGQPANGMQFSTKDVDYDADTLNCAVVFRGAWWYRSCHQSNLNGYYYGGPHASYADGMEWNSWTGYYESMTKTEMKVR